MEEFDELEQKSEASEGSVEPSVMSKAFGSLTDFSTILSKKLGHMDDGYHGMKKGLAEAHKSLSSLQAAIEAQQKQIKAMEKDFQSQRSKVDDAMGAISELDHEVHEQLNEATAKLHDELIAERTNAKIDMNALKAKMQGSLLEAMDLIKEAPKFSTEPANFSAETPDKENIEMLYERIAKLEEAMTLQNSVNQHLSESVHNDDSVNHVYENLYDHIMEIEKKMITVQQENSFLKTKCVADIRDLNFRTIQTEKTLAEISAALGSKNKLQKTKIDMYRSSISGPSPDAKLNMTEAIEEAMKAKFQAAPAPLIIRAVPQSHKKSLSPRGRRPSRKRSLRSPKILEDVTETVVVEEEETKLVETKLEETKKEELKVPSDLIEEGDEEEEEEEEKAPTASVPPKLETISMNDSLEEGSMEQINEDEEEEEEEEEEDKKEEKKEEPENKEDQLAKLEEGEEEESDEEGGYENDNEASDSEDGNDDLFNNQAGGEMSVEQFAADVQYSIDELKEDHGKRIADLETTQGTLKRMAYVIDDIKLSHEAMKNRITVLATQHGSVESQLENAMMTKIMKIKKSWLDVLAEMLHGLENLADSDQEKEELTAEEEFALIHGKDRKKIKKEKEEQRKFFHNCTELVEFLEGNMDCFNPRDSLALTLERLVPKLNEIFYRANDLLAIDKKARNSEEMKFSFDDLICSDLKPNLKQYVEDAVAASRVVLDEAIPKIDLRRRLEVVEKLLSEKAEKAFLNELDQDVRHILKNKVDIHEFQTVTSRFATTNELQHLQSKVIKDSVGNKNMLAKMNNVGDTSGLDSLSQAMNEDFQKLVDRFNMLSKQYQDLQHFCEQFVPREEVHEAMAAVIGEVKMLKRSSVNQAVFKDGLKMKADIDEVERLVKRITSVIGDSNMFNTNVPLDSAESAAAVHAKCLICDKPVIGRAKTTQSRNRNSKLSQPLLSQSNSFFPSGYDKTLDPMAQNQIEEPNMMHRLTDPNQTNQEKAKVAAELTIMRSSIEPLPDIMGEDAAGPAGSYKNRIRSSAGGGMGPSYRKDTR